MARNDYNERDREDWRGRRDREQEWRGSDYGSRGQWEGGQGGSGQGGYGQGWGQGGMGPGYGQGGMGQGYGQGGYGQGFGQGEYGRQSGLGGGYWQGGGQGDWGRGGYGQSTYGQGGYGQSFGQSGSGQGSYGQGFGQSGYRQGQEGYGEGFGQGGYGQGLRYTSTTIIGRYHGRGPKGYRRADDRIREDVSEELTRHPEVDASEVEVQVQNGEVTLTGKVEDRHQKRLAEDLAERVSGVTDVHNQLKVDKGFFAKLFGTGEEAGERDREQERGTSARRSTTGTSGNR